MVSSETPVLIYRTLLCNISADCVHRIVKYFKRMTETITLEEKV